jgi:CubicO group peptidase (beta-lactamase class C family)
MPLREPQRLELVTAVVRWLRTFCLFTGAAGAIGAAGTWYLTPQLRSIQVGTAVVSHTLCSGIFVSGLDPEQLYEEIFKPAFGQGLLSKHLRYDIDREKRQVTVTWRGFFRSRAVYRNAVGCLILHGTEADDTADLVPAVRPESPQPLQIVPSTVKIEAALDRAFAEPDQPPFHRVKEIVILHEGTIIGERYAPGYSASTPILGYSLAKSVTNALIGILVRQGKLSVEARAPVCAWSDPADPRHAITIDQLLRMTSGLALAESDSGEDPVSRMLFLERDMAGFAQRAHIEAPPGSRWDYSSGNTIILSRIIRDTVGGHARDVVAFARRELFEPLGMTTATMEFDATGTPVASMYMLASARDWGRLGMLYLNDGVVAARRILPKGWVDYSASPTLDADYGAGFWTNRGAHGEAALRIGAGLPESSFYASGNLGQRILIVPSAGLVIVRLELTRAPGSDMQSLLHLFDDTVSALKSP